MCFRLGSSLIRVLLLYIKRLMPSTTSVLIELSWDLVDAPMMLPVWKPLACPPSPEFQPTQSHGGLWEHPVGQTILSRLKE